MLFSEAKGRKVVSTSTADTVGIIDGFLVDPTARTVAGMEIKKSKIGDALPWSDVTAFGVDAVTVASPDVIVEIKENDALGALDGKDHHLLGKRVLTTAGIDLGKVDDVDFDPETGSITSVSVDGRQLEGSTLTGVGSYAVILDHRDR